MTMRRLTITQVNHVMKRLRVIARQTTDGILEQLRHQLVPPKLDTDGLTKSLNKLAYDNPQKLVRMCLEWAAGKEPKFLVNARKRREAGFQQFNEVTQAIKEHVANLLSQYQTKLLWESWPEDSYPEFLEQELADSIMEVVTNDED